MWNRERVYIKNLVCGREYYLMIGVVTTKSNLVELKYLRTSSCR